MRAFSSIFSGFFSFLSSSQACQKRMFSSLYSLFRNSAKIFCPSATSPTLPSPHITGHRRDAVIVRRRNVTAKISKHICSNAKVDVWETGVGAYICSSSSSQRRRPRTRLPRRAACRVRVRVRWRRRGGKGRGGEEGVLLVHQGGMVAAVVALVVAVLRLDGEAANAPPLRAQQGAHLPALPSLCCPAPPSACPLSPSPAPSPAPYPAPSPRQRPSRLLRSSQDVMATSTSSSPLRPALPSHSRPIPPITTIPRVTGQPGHMLPPPCVKADL